MMFNLQGNSTFLDVPRVPPPHLSRALQNSTTNSTLSRYVQRDRDILDHQNDYYFQYLNEAINKNVATASNSFVALRPNKVTNGGYGNLLWFFAEVHGVALATKRHAIINNAALNALFTFPNTSTLSNAEVNKYFDQRDTAKYTELMPCGQVAKNPLSSWGTYVFVHGCFGNNLMHPEIRTNLASLLHLNQLSRDDTAEMLFPYLFRWVYSNPQPAFKAIAEQKINNILQKCAVSGDEPIDLAVQVRVFRDNNKDNVDNYFNQTNIYQPYRDCALQNALAALQRKENDVKNRNQPTTNNTSNGSTSVKICVFVTSDSPRISEDIKNHLMSNSSLIMAVTTADLANGTTTQDWLSIAVLKGNQDRVPDAEDFIKRPEFSDWYVISQALASVGTDESTFSGSARQKAGYFHSRHDYRVVRNEQGNFECQPHRPLSRTCEMCRVVAENCPHDVQRECNSRTNT